MKKRFYIYIDRLETGKNANEIIYIGKGNDRRVRCLERNKKYNRKYLKYGIIREIVLGTYDEEFAYEQEIRLIEEYHTFYKDPLASRNVCNLRPGGNGIRSCFSYTPEETRKLKSDALKGNKNGVGYRHSPEWKKSQSERLKGNKNSEGYKYTVEQRKNLSNAMKGKRGNLGFKQSEETKLKRKESIKKFYANLTEEERKLHHQMISDNLKKRYAKWRRDNNRKPFPDDWKFL